MKNAADIAPFIGGALFGAAVFGWWGIPLGVLIAYVGITSAKADIARERRAEK